MRTTGLTRARSMGPVAAAVRRAGGSVSRLFRDAELPLRLIEQPDRLIPLRDQLRVLEMATRQMGDAALPARLSLEGGVEHLGHFGRYVCSAPRLRNAIERCNAGMGLWLQSATRLQLETCGRWARWSYWITDAAPVGRHENELLALGYMHDLLRTYFGVQPGTVRAELPSARRHAGHSIEDSFGCELGPGERAALIFPAAHLDAPRLPRAGSPPAAREDTSLLPSSSDFVAHVECMIELGLQESRPSATWLSRRLGISARSLQRELARHETSFLEVLSRTLLSRAAELLGTSSRPITEIAFELGYSDPAHFTRAFTKWAGMGPQAWRAKVAR